MLIVGEPDCAVDIAHVGIGHTNRGGATGTGVDGEDQVRCRGVEGTFVARRVHGFGPDAVLAIGQGQGAAGRVNEATVGRTGCSQEGGCAVGRTCPCCVVFHVQIGRHGICRQAAGDGQLPVLAGDVVGARWAPVFVEGQIDRRHSGRYRAVNAQQVDRRHADGGRAAATGDVTVVIRRIALSQIDGVDQGIALVQVRLCQHHCALEVGSGGIVGVVDLDLATHSRRAAQQDLERGVAQPGQVVAG